MALHHILNQICAKRMQFLCFLINFDFASAKTHHTFFTLDLEYQAASIPLALFPPLCHIDRHKKKNSSAALKKY